MLFSKREPRSLESRRRGKYRPTTESLETRDLMAAQLINLNAAPQGTGTDTITTPPARTTVLPNLTGDKTSASSGKAYGVDLVGTVAQQSAGISVTDVGDVNGDLYDDFVVGAPAVPRAGGTPSGAVATAYLIFGSRTTNATAISDWLAINANFSGGETGNVGTGRVGNLAQLGNSNTAQFDPYNGLGINANTGLPYAFPFAGIKFIRSLSTGSELGESVAPATVGTSGTRAFMIGSPGTSATDNGRAYLISDAGNLTGLIGTTVDLDTLASSGVSGINVTTFLSTNSALAGGRIGQSVSGVGDVITDGLPDIAIGVPNASINGTASGAVFVVSGTAIQTGVNNQIDLATVGNSTSSTTPGIVFTGAAAGDQAGWSVAPAGNVNHLLTAANQSVDDLLIGAPAIVSGNPGKAYLIYGAVDLASRSSTIGAGPYSLGLVGNTLLPLPTTSPFRFFGMSITGATPGDLTGYSVSSAGNFNGNVTFADIMVGSPGFSVNSGRVDVFYGTNGDPSFGTTLLPSGTLVGNVTLGAVPAGIRNASLVGGAQGDLAGYAISLTGKINSGNGNPILIGAPGFNSNSGTVYVLPPNTNTLQGTQTLLNAFQNTALAATQLVFTTPGAAGGFFGASVSGRLTANGQTKTADGDTIGDFIIGAPSYAALSTPATTRAGGAIVVEGTSIFPLGVPTGTGATYAPAIGIGTPLPPFANITPSSPDPLKVYVLSVAATTTTPAFRPATEISPATVTINGVPFTPAISSVADVNGDGIPEALLLITPTSAIGLSPGPATITVSGATNTTPSRTFSGSADVTVVSNGGGGGGAGAASPVSFSPATTFTPPFGTDRWVPTVSALSRFGSYKPIPLRVALQQFNLSAGFNTRVNNFYNPPKQYHEFGYKAAAHAGHRNSTLGYAIFTRGKYKAGTVKTFTHNVPVVPSNLQTERVGSSPKTVRKPLM